MMEVLKIGSKEFVLEAAKCYTDDRLMSASAFGKMVGIEPRRMQKLFKGDAKMSDEEATNIALHVRVPFKADPIEKAAKPAKKKASEMQDAVGVRGDAKVFVQIYKEAMGFETDTDAATALIRKGFITILKEADNVEG